MRPCDLPGPHLELKLHSVVVSIVDVGHSKILLLSFLTKGLVYVISVFH